MKYHHTLTHLMRRISPLLRERGRVIRKFSTKMGLVYFGTVSQHEDDHSPIRGFSASLTHSDTHYAVGTYNGRDVRVVDRLDIVHTSSGDNHQQAWTIIEVGLESPDIPHVFFVPTGSDGKAYSRLFTTQPYLQPLNTHLTTDNRSREFHGRFQILSRTTYSHQVEQLFNSPTIVGIGSRFWPHGLEVQHGKLFVYLPQGKLTQLELETALASALWLAERIDLSAEEK